MSIRVELYLGIFCLVVQNHLYIIPLTVKIMLSDVIWISNFFMISCLKCLPICFKDAVVVFGND